MNIILSDLVSKRRGWDTLPLNGVAFVSVSDRVHSVRLVDACITELRGLVIDADSADAAEVWFEDARERSH